MEQAVKTKDTAGDGATRWFVRMPAGDTYYGRRYRGRTYEIVPETTPSLELAKGRGYVPEGALPTYPGRVMLDSDNHSVLADGGDTVLRYESSSGNKGGYVETYYTATRGPLKASVMRRPGEVAVDIDAVIGQPGSAGVDRAQLAGLLSFVATAEALTTLSQINDKLSGPDGLPPDGAAIPTDRAVGVRVSLGRLPAEREAGL